VLDRPLHPYTRALLESVPGLLGRLPEPIGGTVPMPNALPPGCLFAPRCGYAEAACDTAPLPLVTARPRHRTSCRRWKEVA
jgi:peptide/nickel transport system permease protein